MTQVIDLADARRRRQSPAGKCDPTAGTAAQPLRIALQLSYGHLGPPAAPIVMPDELRRWLRCWAHAHAWDRARLQGFIEKHETGVATTLDGALHDPDGQRLLAPEVLLVLLALDVDPHALRARWPPSYDVRGVLALADLFGRPYSG